MGKFIHHSTSTSALAGVSSFNMAYSIYISYSMSDSSKAYDLSGKLSREKISYYLDCVESGFTLSDYTKQIIEDCEVFVALVGARYAEAKFASDTLNHAIEHGKRIVVCLVEGTPLPEQLASHTTVNEEDLFALLMGNDENDNEDDNVDDDDNYRWNETVDRRPLTVDYKETVDRRPLTVDHNEDEDDNEDEDENLHPDGLTVDCRPLLFPSASELRLTFDYKNDNENEDENCLPDGLTVDRRPLTVDHNVDELIEHRGTPPPPTQPLISEPSQKNKGCGCGCSFLAYVFVIIMIANFLIKDISGNNIVELGRKFIDTLIENRKSPLERHYESISYEDRKKGEVLYDRGMNFMKEASANPNARDEALACFEEAAALGNVEAMYYAGMCYQKAADGDRKLLEKATKHLYDATVAGKPDCFAQLMNIAEMNIAYAQNCVGVCYAHGYSVERNQMKAVEWYIKAARNGNHAAKYNLAWYYRYGQGGLPTNKHMAYKLYEELAAINYEDAQKLMKEVSKEL
jgi:TPR repeat protein